MIMYDGGTSVHYELGGIALHVPDAGLDHVICPRVSTG
jgi:hypothetical protein